MGLINRIFGAAADAGIKRDPSDDRWFGGYGKRSEAGVNVTIARARQVPVVRDCLQVLHTSVAGLASGLFERAADGSRKLVKDHPLARVLRDPNPRTTSYEFFADMVDDLASQGEFYGELIYDYGVSEFPVEIWRLQKDHCILEELPDKSRRLIVREPGRAERILVQGEFWYIPLPPTDNIGRGRSPILVDGVEAIGSAIALQDYANRFFRNDATPPFVFTHDSHFSDDESKSGFLNAWQRWMTGRNRHKPAVLEYGIKVQQLGATNEQSQFLETRKETALDVARLWRMPPHKVGLLDKATFSNIEHQSLEFVTDVLGPWLELIERSIGKWLINDDALFFEFNVSSLLRGDIKARFEAYAVARQWGWISVNEIRKLENLNGIGQGGDRYLSPLNMREVGANGQTYSAPDADQERSVEKSIAFLRNSVASNGGRPKLEIVKDVA